MNIFKGLLKIYIPFLKNGLSVFLAYSAIGFIDFKDSLDFKNVNLLSAMYFKNIFPNCMLSFDFALILQNLYVIFNVRVVEFIDLFLYGFCLYFDV